MEHDRATLLAAASSSAVDEAPVVSLTAEQATSRATLEIGAPPATNEPPRCYVCDSSDAKGLMRCRNFATCGGAKHARCMGMVAPVASWTCEPCDGGRPRQRPGERYDWAHDLEKEAERQKRMDMLASRGVPGCGLLLVCGSCTIL